MKLSPSFFFHDAIPPSVMVGDMAGILNLVMARDADVALSPSIRASGMIVCGEVKGSVIHLRGWQRADLNNGESDMRADRKSSSVCWGSDGTRWERADCHCFPVISGDSLVATFRSGAVLSISQPVVQVFNRLFFRCIPPSSSSISDPHISSATLNKFIYMVRAPVQHRH